LGVGEGNSRPNRQSGLTREEREDQRYFIGHPFSAGYGKLCLFFLSFPADSPLHYSHHAFHAHICHPHPT
jgi:hypothetical protein